MLHVPAKYHVCMHRCITVVACHSYHQQQQHLLSIYIYIHPGFKYDSVPSEPNADRGKEKPTHRLEAARVQEHRLGSPFGSSVHPASHLRPTVSRSPFSNPHTAARHHPHPHPIPPPPPPPPGGYQLLLLTCRSAAPPSTPLLQLLREAGSISSRRHLEFTAGVAIPSSPPASPSRAHLPRSSFLSSAVPSC